MNTRWLVPKHMDLQPLIPSIDVAPQVITVDFLGTPQASIMRHSDLIVYVGSLDLNLRLENEILRKHRECGQSIMVICDNLSYDAWGAILSEYGKLELFDMMVHIGTDPTIKMWEGIFRRLGCIGGH